MRILSLLPAATEIVYLLGLEKYLVGVSHECDWPPQAQKKPKVTFSGQGVCHIKERAFKKLSPNLILTQELCEVCAVGFNQVKKAARILDGQTKIISLEPESVEDILENIMLIGEVTGSRQEARRVVEKLKKRLKIYDLRFKKLKKRPNVLVIEWLEPLMVAGHWIPQMIELAGGENLITKPGQKSNIITIHQMLSSNPDILIISPCGFDIERTKKERIKINDLRFKIKTPKVFLVDGNSYMTRPGPRIIDGIEILSEILHPDIFLRRYTKKDWMEFR